MSSDLQAGHLQRTLKSSSSKLATNLNRATAKSTYPVWTMNAIGDISFHHAGADPLPRWYQAVGRLFDQFLGAAETDPALAEWLLRRFSLLDSLYLAPSAPMISRAIAHNLRLWLKELRNHQRDRRTAIARQ